MVSPSFNPFLNGDKKIIYKNLEQQFESNHIKIKPKLAHILNFANILEGEMKRQPKMAVSTEHQYHHL